MADDVPAPRKGSLDQRWQGQGGYDADAAAGARRRFWFILLAALSLAFGTAAAVWILLIKPPPPPPYFLAINIGDYNSRHYPLLPFAKQDGDRVLRHFPSKNDAQTKTK